VFSEDISAFFSGAEFAVQATFTSAGGAPVSALVMFNAQTQDIFGDSVLTNEYSIVYPVTSLVGVKSGDQGTVDGIAFRVRDVRLKADGQLVTATLSKL